MAATIFDHNLEKNPANYAPLTPLSFLERAAYVYPQRISLIHGAQRYSWGETYARCRRLASALAKRGIGIGETVAAMLPNTPPMYEAHFGVAMAGAVLNTLNTRLDAEAIAFMLDHGEARLLITDKEFAPTIEAALKFSKKKITVVDAEDPQFQNQGVREDPDDNRWDLGHDVHEETHGSSDRILPELGQVDPCHDSNGERNQRR